MPRAPLHPKLVPPGSMSIEQITDRMRAVATAFDRGAGTPAEARALMEEYAGLEIELERLTDPDHVETRH